MCLLLSASEAYGQSSITDVSITAESSRVRVAITSSLSSKEWSFRNSYAGALGLGDRIEEVSTKDAKVRKLASGEFESERAVSDFQYVVRLDDVRPGDLAHVSWLSSTYGFLMLGDLLPEVCLKQPTLRLRFSLPVGWNVLSSGESQGGEFLVDSPEDAIFFVSNDLSRVEDKSKRLQLVFHGAWKFKEKDALRYAEKVFESYLELTKFRPTKPTSIFVAPIPTSATSSHWKAETRGSTVVLLINKQGAFNNWLGQLGVIFTHELFHVWMPHSLKLEGSYDWFFEGFTLYVALQTALKLNLIKFEEYLATLARVYDSYLSYTDNQSLIDASMARWTSSGSLVYDKGMLVAFLYDLTLRRETGSAQTLKGKYQQLFLSLAGKSIDANAAIIDLLSSSAGTRQIVTSYVEGKKGIELPELLAPFGLEAVVGSSRSELKVRKEITSDQSKLLKSLGYRR